MTVFFPAGTATLIVPVRLVPVVLGDTVKAAVPGPDPEAAVMVIQLAAAPLGLAVQSHTPAVAVTAMLPSPPAAKNEIFVGETAVTLHGAPLWLTEKTEPPMVACALLALAVGFCVTVIFTVPLLLAKLLSVAVTHESLTVKEGLPHELCPEAVTFTFTKPVL